MGSKSACANIGARIDASSTVDASSPPKALTIVGKSQIVEASMPTTPDV